MTPSDLHGPPDRGDPQRACGRSGPGLLSRLGYRAMACSFRFTRKGPVLEERLRSSGVGPGQVVLDYACGPGYYAIPAARLVGPTGRVVAVDIQPRRHRHGARPGLVGQENQVDAGLREAGVAVTSRGTAAFGWRTATTTC